MPVLHLIAGPHGAGKSSLYQYLLAPRLPGLPFLNAQMHARAQLSHIPDLDARARAARVWVDSRCQELMVSGESFVAETAFSHFSRVGLMMQARALGFDVVLYAIAMDEPRRLLARIDQSVREGGYRVPAHKVLDRYARCLDNLRQAVVLADLALVLDSGDAPMTGPRLVATVNPHQLYLHTVVRPRWVDRILGFAEDY